MTHSTFKSIKILPNSRLHFANINSRTFNINSLTSQKIDDYDLDNKS